MTNGYYSIVQYCPNRFRSELANVGLIIISFQPKNFKVRMIKDLDRVNLFFNNSKKDSLNLNSVIESMENRIRSEKFKSLIQLSNFCSSRANDLRITQPRKCKIDDFEKESERLFFELVELPTNE